MRVLEPEIQERRYNHKEERKKIKINHAIERRKEIMENPDKLFTKVFYILFCLEFFFIGIIFSFYFFFVDKNYINY